LKKYQVVLITTPNRKTSERLSRLLVDKRLAACVNAVPGGRSRYRWRGKVETAREELLIVKTRAALLKELMLAVRQAHPYAVCEILALGVGSGNPPYVRWLDDSTRRAKT